MRNEKTVLARTESLIIFSVTRIAFFGWHINQLINHHEGTKGSIMTQIIYQQEVIDHPLLYMFLIYFLNFVSKENAKEREKRLKFIQIREKVFKKELKKYEKMIVDKKT
jgi:hypothetical protein